MLNSRFREAPQVPAVPFGRREPNRGFIDDRTVGNGNLKCPLSLRQLVRNTTSTAVSN